MQSKSFLGYLLMAGALLGGCGAPGDEGDPMEVSCGGKCDGLGNVSGKEVNPPSKWSVKGLLAQGLALGDKELDKGVGTGFSGFNIKVSALATRVFGLQPQQANLNNGTYLKIEDLNAVKTGMAAKFGENELSTAINKVRADYLTNHPVGTNGKPTVFAESKFMLEGDYGYSYGYNTKGLFSDGYASSHNLSSYVGINLGGQVETHVISAYDGELQAIFDGALNALYAMRGFVQPSDLNDLRKMKPGDLVARRGDGHIGLNFGASVPVLVANVGSFGTNTLTVHASIGTRVEGTIDLQLACLSGEESCKELVVDVGLSNVKSWAYEVGFKDSWGVSLLKDINFDVGPVKLDVAKMVNKGLEKMLNRKFASISGTFRQSTSYPRLSITRFRFLLDQEDAEHSVEQAIAQAWHGDTRLAEMLSMMQHPGIKTDFELFRSGTSRTTYAGIDAYGMSFFVDKLHEDGQVDIQSGNQDDTLTWDTVGKRFGWAFSEHGYRRTGLSALEFTPEDILTPLGNTNLLMKMNDKPGATFAKAMNRDRMLDHVDAVILALGGEDVLRIVENAGNPLQHQVESACMGQETSCALDQLTAASDVVSGAMNAYGQVLPSLGLTDDQSKLLTQAVMFRLGAQESVEVYQDFARPAANVSMDLRLDDDTLGQILGAGQESLFASKLAAYLGAVDIDRERTDLGDYASARASLHSASDKDIRRIAKIYAGYAQKYRQNIALENLTNAQYGKFGRKMLTLVLPTVEDSDGNVLINKDRLTVEKDNEDLLNEVSLHSFAEARSAVAMQWFDALYKAMGSLSGPKTETLPAYSARDLDNMSPQQRLDYQYAQQRIARNASRPPKEQILEYTLLSMTPANKERLTWATNITDIGQYAVYQQATVPDLNGTPVIVYKTGVTGDTRGNDVNLVEQFAGDGWTFNIDALTNFAIK